MVVLVNINKGIAMNNNVSLDKLVHDARAPLNHISMNAELVKLVLENDMPKQKALEAVAKIIANCQLCSEHLQEISDTYAGE